MACLMSVNRLLVHSDLDLLQTWQQLDSHTPPEMAEIESFLWDVLLKAVVNPQSLPMLLRAAVQKIDLNALQSVGPAVRHFLRTSMSLSLHKFLLTCFIILRSTSYHGSKCRRGSNTIFTENAV
jgi:hypothetical protein